MLWEKENALMHFLEYRKMIRKKWVGRWIVCASLDGMGKNGNEHKQWCEELDGDGDEDEDENWGWVWFT